MPRDTHEDLDVGHDLVITSTPPRDTAPGSWVCGTLHGHRFAALVFAEHADQPDYELGDSRISKLWIERLADRTTVVNFDRGWDIHPADEVARRIAGFLKSGLAEHVYGG